MIECLRNRPGFPGPSDIQHAIEAPDPALPCLDARHPLPELLGHVW